MFGDNFEWDNTEALADEGMSLNEKRKTVKLALPFAIIAILVSAGLIYITTVIKGEYSEMSHFFYNLIFTVAITGIVISFFVLLWVGSHRLIKKNDDLLDNHNPFDTVLFLVTLLQILINIGLILYIFLENRIIKDYYIAENGTEGFKKFIDNYGHLIDFGIIGLVL